MRRMRMSADLPLLDNIRIAKPCPMAWEEMSTVGEGDRARFCGHCNLNVHNLSAMTRPEVDALLRKQEGRLCVGYFQSADGIVLMKETSLRIASRRPIVQGIRVMVSLTALIGSLIIARPASALPDGNQRRDRVQVAVRDTNVFDRPAKRTIGMVSIHRPIIVINAQRVEAEDTAVPSKTDKPDASAPKKGRPDPSAKIVEADKACHFIGAIGHFF
jgi:hypothetical protein